MSIVAPALLAVAPASLLISLTVGCFVGCTVAASQTAVYALGSSGYPDFARGTEWGARSPWGGVGSVSSPRIAGTMLGTGAAPEQVLAVLVPMMVVAGLAAWSVGKPARHVSSAA